MRSGDADQPMEDEDDMPPLLRVMIVYTVFKFCTHVLIFCSLQTAIIRSSWLQKLNIVLMLLLLFLYRPTWGKIAVATGRSGSGDNWKRSTRETRKGEKLKGKLI
jgi:hypothetical protein